MMITRRHLLLAIAATCLLTMFAITIVPIRSQTAGQYDPWLDINGDGTTDGGDIIQEARAFGTAGDPTKNVNVTNWPQQQAMILATSNGSININIEGDSSIAVSLDTRGYRRITVIAASIGWALSFDIFWEISNGSHILQESFGIWGSTYRIYEIYGYALVLAIHNGNGFNVDARIDFYETA